MAASVNFAKESSQTFGFTIGSAVPEGRSEVEDMVLDIDIPACGSGVDMVVDKVEVDWEEVDILVDVNNVECVAEVGPG